jgi:prefoldin subunit 5
MSQNQIHFNDENSVQAGPGRTAKGKKKAPVTDQGAVRRNGPKITISLTPEEKVEIDSAKASIFTNKGVSYAGLLLQLVREKQQSIVAVNSPANIAETNERIVTIENSISELANDVQTVSKIVTGISTSVSSKGQLAAKIDGTNNEISNLKGQIESLLASQLTLSKQMNTVITAAIGTTTSMNSLTEHVKALSPARGMTTQVVMPRSPAGSADSTSRSNAPSPKS